MNTLGEVIRQRRKALRYSQAELASKAAISQTYLSDLERRPEISPDRDKLTRLATALEMDADDLLTAAGLVPDSFTPEDAALLSKWHALPPESQALVSALVEQLAARHR